ncbi:MAG: cytochrome c biogenesis protein ResB [Chitinophagales bacterium]
MAAGSFAGPLGRTLRSPRLAIALLAAFAAACLVGNLAPQVGIAGADAVAAWQATHPGLAHLLRLIDGFSLFTSGWFLVLTGLLALSTLACTIDQFRRVRRSAAHPPVGAEGARLLPPAPTREILLGLDQAAAARRVAEALRRLGLRVRPADPRAASAGQADVPVLAVRGETVGLGRWSSPLFHLGLVLLFVAVIAGALTQWSTTLLLAEGGAFDPAKQPAHGDPGQADGSRPALAGRIPPVMLIEHLPRYQLKRYQPDAASRLQVGGRPQFVSMGRPLTLGRLTLRQARRYGALAEVVIRPAGSPSSEPALVRRATDSPPPDFGGPVERPDGSYQAGLVFVNQENAERQERPLYLPMLGGTATFRLVPQATAANYRLPLYQRFQLAMTFTPDAPASQASGPTGTAASPAALPAQRLLRPGESLSLGGWTITFPSLRYWTTFTVTSTPLTPVFFLLSWLCIGALGLGLFSPPRWVEAVVLPAPQGRGTVLRYHVMAGRGGAFFAERTHLALSRLEEAQE